MRELLENPGDLGDATEEDWKALERILFDFDSVDRGGHRISLDFMENMYLEWLSRIRP